MSYSDIIVAVHGVGDQMRNETIRSVATRLARIGSLAGNQVLIAPQPLGYFFRTDVHPIPVSPIDRMVGGQLSHIGFSEAYWADIPDQVLKDEHTMEETKAWARTVVSRARAVFFRSEYSERPDSLMERLQLREPDFGLAAEVLDEMIDSIAVLQNLLFLADKAGVVKFNLRSVLEKYVDDVQVVTEFGFYRSDILGRFHYAMERIHAEHENANLHIVAHSEGTVVSFLGLLHAMCGNRVTTEESRRQQDPKIANHLAWYKKVRGYMTIGSPIDKHLLLWPELFAPFPQNALAKALAARDDDNKKIKWRNYYDYGDPVGFKLNTARKWLSENNCEVFDFDPVRDDIGFSRYLWPGKAHTDYWTDAAVFKHFVYDVVLNRDGVPKNSPKPPTDRPITKVTSVTAPYVASFLVLLAGTVLLYRTVSHFIHPSPDPVQKYVWLMTVGEFPQTGAGIFESLKPATGIALLIAGVTLLARWPRIVRGVRWWFTGACAFGIGCLGYGTDIFVPSATRQEIGAIFSPGYETAGTLLAALFVAAVGLSAIVKPKPDLVAGDSEQKKFRQRLNDAADAVFNAKANRRTRWFSRQMRPLIFAGACVIALILIHQMWPRPVLTDKQRHAITASYFDRKTRDLTNGMDVARINAIRSAAETEANAHAEDMEKLLEPQPSVWPVVGAGLAFLYLWWLAALLFDLTFVWHWYIRRSKLTDRLEQWREKPKGAGGEPPATTGMTLQTKT